MINKVYSFLLPEHRSFLAFVLSLLLLVALPNWLRMNILGSQVENYDLSFKALETKLDSIVSVQNEIAKYDLIIDLAKFNMQLSTIREPSKYNESYDLNEQLDNLRAYSDSLDIALASIDSNIAVLGTFFDSISPKYPLAYREDLTHELHNLKKNAVIVLQKKSSILHWTRRIISLLIIVSYLLYALFYPARWIRMWLKGDTVRF